MQSRSELHGISLHNWVYKRPVQISSEKMYNFHDTFNKIFMFIWRQVCMLYKERQMSGRRPKVLSLN